MRSEPSTRFNRPGGIGASRLSSSRAGAYRRPGAFCFLLVAVLPACGVDAPDPRRAADSPVPASASPSGSPSVTQQGGDSLALELVVPPEVRAGEVVPLTMRVRNVSARPRDLYLRGRSPTLDVIITTPNGDTLWHRLRDEVIPAILGLRALGPGEELEIEARWDQRTEDGMAAAPGEYQARGVLLTDGDPLVTALVSFRIRAR